MIGKVSVFALLAISLLAALFYFVSYRKNNKTLATTGRALFYIAAFGQLFLSAFMMNNILTHNFQYTYIFSYSSTMVDGFLLGSTFWAGQEGSLMLWALFVAIIGVVLIPYAKKYNYEPLVMGIYSLILLFMFIFLSIKSPFNYIWESFPKENLEAGFMPKDGRGLNPVLENYWMAIHPPILFIGYTLLSVPFAFAFAGMVKKEFHNWIKVAIPWTLVAGAVFTIGLSLGGFWAYETLGWGGFWAWDPVENSSFLPWLTAIALIHTMKVQRNNGGLIRTNFILATLTFSLVLYASYLTRSGVLSDSSVHSFAADANAWFKNMLLIFLFFFTALGFGTLILRLKSIPEKAKKPFKVASKESALTVAALLLLAICSIVIIGTSTPIINFIPGINISSVDAAFYNKINLPVIILMLALASASVFLSWRANTFEAFIKKFYVSLGIGALLSLVIIFALGITSLGIILLTFAASVSLTANLEILIKVILKKPKKAGAYIAHIGLAFLMIGIASLATNSKSKNVRLPAGEEVTVFGYDVKWAGWEQVEKELKDRQKFNYIVEVTGRGGNSFVKPVFYWSAFNNYQQPFLQPGISSHLAGDIYVSPISTEIQVNYSVAGLRKNNSALFPVDSSKAIELAGYDMSRIEIDSTNSRALFGAVVSFIDSDTMFTDTLYAEMMGKGTYKPIWHDYKGSGLKIGLYDFNISRDNPDNSTAYFAFTEDKKPEVKQTDMLIVEFSLKPYITLVWVGFILMAFGLVLPVGKPRVKEADKIKAGSDK